MMCQGACVVTMMFTFCTWPQQHCILLCTTSRFEAVGPPARAALTPDLLRPTPDLEPTLIPTKSGKYVPLKAPSRPLYDCNDLLLLLHPSEAK